MIDQKVYDRRMKKERQNPGCVVPGLVAECYHEELNRFFKKKGERNTRSCGTI
jgi:hypothetical protein